MAKERSCRSCVYWDKPAKDRSHAGAVYACTAPLPVLNMPESVLKANHTYLDIAQRAYMSRDEGKKCGAWADAIPPAPKP